MTIIKCPYCSLYGEKKNLAEIIPGGLKIIRRSDDGSVEFTIVKTSDYAVVCGSCGNLATYREAITPLPTGTMLVNWGTLYAFYEKNSIVW